MVNSATGRPIYDLSAEMAERIDALIESRFSVVPVSVY